MPPLFHYAMLHFLYAAATALHTPPTFSSLRYFVYAMLSYYAAYADAIDAAITLAMLQRCCCRADADACLRHCYADAMPLTL